MSDAVISRIRTVILMALCGPILSTHSLQAQEQAPRQASPTTAPTALNVSALEPQTFLQLLLARNIEVQYSKLSADAAGFLKEGEASLYEPTAFMTLREEGRNRQRTAEEILQNVTTAGTSILDESVRSDELGIRNKLPTGGEVTVSYKESRKDNNLIPHPATSKYGTDYTTLLSLTLKQPLLRNAGRTVTETDRRVAELEHQIALQQLTQQTLKSSIDGMSLYWQLHRAEETTKLRKEAVTSAEGLLVDAGARMQAGKVAASAVLELQGVLLNRKAELTRSQEALREAQSKLATALNIPWNESNPISTEAQQDRNEPSPLMNTPALEDALRLWSPYQIALLKQRQAQARLNFAQNQTRPLVDLVVSYSGTGYSTLSQEARKYAGEATYPEWYVGLNFELPLKGNQKAQQQFLAQSTRLTQAELEMAAIRNSFANDFAARLSDLRSARTLLESSHEEVKLRQTVFDNERQRIKLGSGSLGTLIQRQVDLTESKQRLLENQVRFELAMATWQYTRGSLLSDNHIQVSNELTSEQ